MRLASQFGALLGLFLGHASSSPNIGEFNLLDDFLKRLGLPPPGCNGNAATCDCSQRCTCEVVSHHEQGHPDLIRSINISDCSLTGEFPYDILRKLSHLETLVLRRSGLSGAVPPGLKLPSNLGVLDMSGNQLTGDASAFLDTLTKRGVRELVLSNNQLSGHLPEFAAKRLKKLNLAGNKMTGRIPVQFFQLPSLEELDLAGNLLAGTLPEYEMLEGSEASPLRRLRLEGNQLSGVIPRSIGSLSNLEVLRLEHNQLEGEIPQELARLDSLRELRLNSNRLHGRIPERLGHLAGLVVLQLNDLRLTGPVPNLGNLKNLELLDLSWNSLSGPLSPEMAKLRRMRSLSLQHNFFTGNLPAFDMPDLRIALLNDNKLSGPLTETLCQMPQLLALGLHKNRLNGLLPKCLGEMASLTQLFLAGNAFEGTIPEGIASLEHLQVITLHANGLGGQLPNLASSSLTIATFHDNDFAGRIPEFNLSRSCTNSPWFRLHGLDCFQLGEVMYRAKVKSCTDLESIYKMDISRLLRDCPQICRTCNDGGALDAKVTLHGNRLACSVPRSINSSELLATAVMGNMLGDGSPLQASWLPLEDASSRSCCSDLCLLACRLGGLQVLAELQSACHPRSGGRSSSTIRAGRIPAFLQSCAV